MAEYTEAEVENMTDAERVEAAEKLWHETEQDLKETVVFLIALQLVTGDAHLGVAKRVFELALAEGIDAPDPAWLDDLA